MSLLVAGSLALTLFAAKPDHYTEKSLCDLTAGAACHATACLKDAKERCTQSSRKCRGTSRSTVPKDRADRAAACAKATLKAKCGSPAPSECEGMSL
ncbi:MAG: hypothetical protein ACYC8T_10225 [Myxococcaceae bacterium]